MSEQENLGPGDGAEETDDVAALGGELLWNIATGEEPCDDPKIYIQARHFAALMMRKTGTPYREIASFLECSVSTAHKYVVAEMKKRIDESVDDIRRMHLERYEAMLAGIYDRATEGDTFAIPQAMAIMTRIETLMGVEPPKRVEHTFGDVQRTAAINTLAKAISGAAAERDADEGSEGASTGDV